MRVAILSLLVSVSIPLISSWSVSHADSIEPVRWGGAASPNMSSRARDLPAELEGREPIWELRLGTHQYTIPTIDRGRLYIGIDDAAIDRPGVRSTGGGILKCIEQATGKTIWQLSTPRYFEGMREPYHYNQWKWTCAFCWDF